ncbi:MAG TPA: TRAM domain-containing protein [Clostridiaceae bacterium]|nr:TRAM domain-containing protein [Clostridiaceae bacterium]
MGESYTVLNRVIKISFAAVGAITGYTLTRTLFYVNETNASQEIKIALYLFISLVSAVIFYTTGNKVIESVMELFDKVESAIQKMTLYELAISSVGLIIGLIVANLITIPINKVDVIGVPISIAVNILFGCIGIGLAIGKRNEDLFEVFKNKGGFSKNSKGSPGPKVLDTSVIIDGRIVDICRSGFIEGELIIPGFVLEELRRIADSSDVLKRNKGRRGLDVLNILQKELKHPIRIENITIDEGEEVDSALLKFAKRLGGKVLTIDYNLNKVASLQDVTVLNINELANAVKPIALPGEEMTVQVIKDGRENGQGVAYLDDGTMIVVDGGKKHIGESISVMVTSVLQTAAGRMIFAKPKCSVNKIL